ncbi:hypothetical protein ACLOJK_004244 [Asimina triloba]
MIDWTACRLWDAWQGKCHPGACGPPPYRRRGAIVPFSYLFLDGILKLPTILRGVSYFLMEVAVQFVVPLMKGCAQLRQLGIAVVSRICKKSCSLKVVSEV